MSNGPLAILYEHPHWFRPLFDELERRGIPHVRLHASEQTFDAASYPPAYGAVFNRMSPSAWQRGRGGAIFYTHDVLAWLEQHGVQTINGSGAFRIETSKARQLELLARLGLPAPRARVVTGVAALPAAAEWLEFPVVVKPNIGGSGAGIIRFDAHEDLVRAVERRAITPGIDGVILVQEYHRPVGNSIVRVETLEGEYLYAIRVHLGDQEEFNLCPADVCRTVDGDELFSAACPTGAAKLGLRVERYEPPREIVEAVERISRAASIDVGGIEYLESSRDDRLYFYDINALSNFVADPLKVIGFDPTARLVDALEARLLRRVA
jgi:glutathione synthase/RimK-type ligase-like ATP-grasp enzyme